MLTFSRKFLAIGVLSACLPLLLLTGRQAIAAGPPHGGFEGGGLMEMELLRKVGLSGAQWRQVGQILQANRPKFRNFYTQLSNNHEQMMTKLFSTGPVTSQDLAPFLQTDQQLRSQIEQEKITVALAIRAVLTPEQLSKAAALHAQLTQLREQMRSLLESTGDAPPAAPPPD